MPAGDNEKKLRRLVLERFGEKALSGKRSYASFIDGHDDKVYISVDDTIFLPDGSAILIEVDSGNYAKLIAGQYALVNGLFDGVREKTLFLVVHFYKSSKDKKEYTSGRTIKNLNAIQKFNPEAVWLPYAVLTFSEFSEIVSISNSIEELCTALWAISSAVISV
ncbi:putative mRNA-degrading endonuclease RelE of RelBE toxin-antitoxin system [Pseudomonas sp. IT-P258]|uniref:hypothetical protein n=1 Tax=Pseudomonas sp. IT-P258 TaxID=3026447 RepID=UPI0039DF5729